MRETDAGRVFSATDLAAFLECEQRALLELAVLEGRIERPRQNEIERRLLELRGVEHERRVLEYFRSTRRDVVTIPLQPGERALELAAEATREAMSQGADVIYQGVLAGDGLRGRPDFLIRAAAGYEVVDAKLSRELKARAVLQVCAYTAELARMQGFTPRHLHLAVGGERIEPVPLLAADFMAYYRAARRRLQRFLLEPAEAYPEPVEHCDVCHFWKRCEERRRADDHPSLVAGITRRQRDRLRGAGIATLRELAALDPGARVEGVGREALERVREQARLQAAARESGQPRYELLLEFAPGTGLEALPERTPGDLFLDLEGDAFYRGQGLEYLFGVLELGEPADAFDFSQRDAPGEPRYRAFWAEDREAEKRAFEAVIDRIVRGREEFHALHVFHFGQRESDALKKLSCRHKTREAEVDRLLRDHVLVDLHPIVRHGLRASVEGYTLKQLEAFHGFRREIDLRAAARAMQLFGYGLETGEAAGDATELRTTIQKYNEEDCCSTLALLGWLETLRGELGARLGRRLTRPVHESAPENGERTEKNQATAELSRRLLASADGPEGAARALLAHLLEWHWREAKSGWWEYHRARELPPPDRLEDRAVLAELDYSGVVGKLKQSQVHRYTFPEQEHALRSRPDPIDPETGKPAGSVVDIKPEHIDLKRGARSSVGHPRALIPGKPIQTDAHEGSLLWLGEALLSEDRADEARAARELLSRSAPRTGQSPGDPLLGTGERLEQGLARLALALDGSVLAVQGPPGSGKTHQAALMIRELVRAGRRVGVTANSHAVIKHLLRKVVELAGDVPVRALHLADEADDGGEPFEIDDDKKKALARVGAGEISVLGGTSWTFVQEGFAGSVDVLVIDEAGQVALANALAVARAARSLVLFGDPAQLEQPQKGVHPEGAEVSALSHLLGGDALTLPPELGVFLPRTRRLHPAICEFISDVFYEGRLETDPELGLEHQAVKSSGPLSGAGLRYVPVVHRGNTNEAPEEVAKVRELVQGLLAGGATFTDRGRASRALRKEDILVVAPYNAQVAALKRALPEIQVGTVDKFQGQEAPVVIYSMATSTGEDAPRGLEFLYSLNRLNVAVSRAQALSVLVASPELARVACKTPRQMKLVNALCAYIERAPILA